MKKIIILIILIVSLFGYDFNDIDVKCDQIIKRTLYTVCYSYKEKGPLFSYYKITYEQVNKKMKRLRTFYVDKSIPVKYRITNEQYLNSGWDKGHLSPAFENDVNKTTRKEANILSNVVPQQPYLNRYGAWRDVERLVNSMVFYNDLIIISGAIYNTEEELLLDENELNIPESMYKIILVPKLKKYAIFIFPNERINKTEKYTFLSSKEELLEMSGINFNIPKDYVYFTENELKHYRK